MLDPLRDDQSSQLHRNSQHPAHPILLAEVSDELHGLGVPIVVIKLGDQGLYLSTSRQLAAQSQRAAWQDFHWRDWEDRCLLAPCFEVKVAGTTGSEDCTIAGILWALINGAPPEQALRWATAVGAYCVASADATSNVPSWPQIQSRLRSPWTQRPLAIPLPDWKYCTKRGVYIGPHDLTSEIRTAS